MKWSSDVNLKKVTNTRKEKGNEKENEKRLRRKERLEKTPSLRTLNPL